MDNVIKDRLSQNSLTEPGGYYDAVRHAHNNIIQTCLSVGIPMMVAYCICLIRLCVKSLRILFSQSRISFKPVYAVQIIIFSFMLTGLVECRIVPVMSCVFVLAAGWLSELNRIGGNGGSIS